MSDDNPDPGVTSQLDRPKDSSARSLRMELSQSERDKYDKIINLLDCSTDSGSIESAQILSLMDRPYLPQQSPLRITSASTMASTKKDKKLKMGAKPKADGWTLDSQDLRTLSKDRLAELSLSGNIYNVTLRNLDSATP